MALNRSDKSRILRRYFPGMTRNSEMSTEPSLGSAIAVAEDSDLLRETLGEYTFNSFIRNKKIEWEEYRATVTDYEVSRYLPAL